MKQIIAILTIGFILFSCGGKKEQEKVDEIKEEVTETVEEVAEEVEEKTEEVIEESKEIANNVAKKTEELASGVKKVMKGKGEWTGSVVFLTDFVTGKASDLTKDQAVDAVKANKMIAFLVDGTPYLVFNTDGSYASKALAKALADGSVTIKGKINSVGGMNSIIADIIE
jgi:uncharacterized protein YoxC